MSAVINPASAYALLSLVSAGANDVVFKRYSSRDRSRGMFIFGIGAVWLILQAARSIAARTPFHADAVTLAFGLAAGLLLVLSNILFLESLTHINVSLGSTIYRLNTIGVLLLSLLVLGEPLGPFKSGGIALGIAAILLLYRKDGYAGSRLAALYTAIAVAASFLRACYGVISKSGINHSADPDTMLVITAACWVAGGLGYAAFREHAVRFTGKKAAYSALSGLLVFLIVNFLMQAVRYGEASIVIPLANMSFVVALLLSSLLGLESMNPKKMLAVASAALSIMLLARS